MSDKSTHCNRDSQQSCTNQNAKWRQGDSSGQPKSGAWKIGPLLEGQKSPWCKSTVGLFKIGENSPTSGHLMPRLF